MSSDDPVTKTELDFLRSQVVALWRALAEVQAEIARIHENRIKALLSEPPVDAAKLN